ncbi:putative methyltransferase-domain-containing protein [Blastocladiella britannica]|nr:putative methyltransferase-domain-containing protein [Blastocladiella britannica]
MQLVERTDTAHHGTTVWPAGETLCYFFYAMLQKTPTAVRGKTVLELGAGTGILSAALGLMGARVTATDMAEPVILDNLRANIARNATSATDQNTYAVSVHAHNWGTVPSDPVLRPSEGTDWDYVVAADCVYTLEPLPLLLASIDAVAGPKTVVFVAMERRDPVVSDQCVERAKALGFDVAKVPRNKLNRAVAHESMEVYKMKRRPRRQQLE